MLALLVITLFSCKKETGSVGLQDGDDDKGLIRVDTLSLYTRTVLEDSIRSDDMSYQLLGATQDADFGFNQSSVVTAFRLPGANFSFPAGTQIDSVVLQLKYLDDDQFSGNLNTPMNIQVSEIDYRMYDDSSYYSNQSIPLISGTGSTRSGLVHKLGDSVDIVENGVSVRYAPHMRIPLSAAIVNKIQNAGASELASNQAFKDYMNGVKIEVDAPGLANGEGNIVMLDLRHTISGMAVYFNDTGKYLFPIGTDGIRVNLYSHDFSNAPLIQAQINASGQSFDKTYVQSMAGLKTKIEVPGLLNIINDGTYAVVNARFEFNYDDAQVSSEFTEFSRMLLLKRNEDGKNDFVADQLLEADLYGGSLDETEDRYVFNITREVQAILTSFEQFGIDANTGFFLIAPSDGPISASHLAMDMQKGGSRGIKFILTLVKSN